jgi:hypothetical protein
MLLVKGSQGISKSLFPTRECLQGFVLAAVAIMNHNKAVEDGETNTFCQLIKLSEVSTRTAQSGLKLGFQYHQPEKHSHGVRRIEGPKR